MRVANRNLYTLLPFRVASNPGSRQAVKSTLSRCYHHKRYVSAKHWSRAGHRRPRRRTNCRAAHCCLCANCRERALCSALNPPPPLKPPCEPQLKPVAALATVSAVFCVPSAVLAESSGLKSPGASSFCSQPSSLCVFGRTGQGSVRFREISPSAQQLFFFTWESVHSGERGAGDHARSSDVSTDRPLLKTVSLHIRACREYRAIENDHPFLTKMADTFEWRVPRKNEPAQKPCLDLPEALFEGEPL